jgi:hypothetical protein
MNTLRKALADTDGASVLTSRTSRSRLGRGVAGVAGRQEAISEAHKGAFTHACAARGSINECAAEAIALFLQAFATQIGAPVKRVYFSFVLALVKRLELFRASSSSYLLGDMARNFMAFPILAYTIMSSAAMHPNPLTRVAELCALLNDKLPSEAPLHTWEGTEMKLVTTRMNARCAIPFAFGLNRLIPNKRLDFVIKAIVNGELKSVRYFLSYVLPKESDGPTAVEESDSDSSSGSDSDSSSEAGAGLRETAAGAGAGAGAGPDELAAGAGLRETAAEAEAEVGLRETAAGVGPGEAAAPLADEPRAPLVVSRLPIHMRAFLTQREFRAIVERMPPSHIFEFLNSFGMHDPPYRFVPDVDARDVIMKEQAYIPPCRGSVLRAYCRSVLDVDVDQQEPEIQTFSDCVC